MLQEKDRKIQELEGRLMQNSSPLASLQDKLRQAEARKQENDKLTINHLSQMEEELSEALEHRDQIELKLKTQSAEFIALRERHQAAMSNSMQMERNNTSLRDELSALQTRLSRTEQMHAQAESRGLALAGEVSQLRQIAQQATAPAEQAKSGGLFRSGSVLKKKNRAQSEDFGGRGPPPSSGSRASVSDLSIAPDQFEQFTTVNTNRSNGDQASISSASGSIGRSNSLLRRMGLRKKRSGDLSMSSPAQSTASFVDTADRSPTPRLRTSVDFGGRSDIPRPVGRLATIPSSDLLEEMAPSNVRLNKAETQISPTHVRSPSNAENAPPGSDRRTSMTSKLPLPLQADSERPRTLDGRTTPIMSTNSAVPVSNISTPTSPGSTLLKLRKPAEERDRERYQPHQPHKNNSASNVMNTPSSPRPSHQTFNSSATAETADTLSPLSSPTLAEAVVQGTGNGNGNGKAVEKETASPPGRHSLERERTGRHLPTLSLAERQSRAMAEEGRKGGAAAAGKGV